MIQMPKAMQPFKIVFVFLMPEGCNKEKLKMQQDFGVSDLTDFEPKTLKFAHDILNVIDVHALKSNIILLPFTPQMHTILRYADIVHTVIIPQVHKLEYYAEKMLDRDLPKDKYNFYTKYWYDIMNYFSDNEKFIKENNICIKNQNNSEIPATKFKYVTDTKDAADLVMETMQPLMQGY